MKKTAPKKLSLHKETVINLKQIPGGLYYENDVASGGPAICWFSDCNPCF